MRGGKLEKKGGSVKVTAICMSVERLRRGAMKVPQTDYQLHLLFVFLLQNSSRTNLSRGQKLNNPRREKKTDMRQDDECAVRQADNDKEYRGKMRIYKIPIYNIPKRNIARNPLHYSRRKFPLLRGLIIDIRLIINPEFPHNSPCYF